ncbi:potassium channel family protein [Clostridium algoriphilum]|uniref:potassium channel family protein n=1 Tax=Clostridium algoriphilum TaxID=198347 RepID=UPI00384E93EB
MNFYNSNSEIHIDYADRQINKIPIINKAGDSVYFSIINFTTVGFGDVQPIDGWCRCMTCIECLLGVFFTASFITVLARKY